MGWEDRPYYREGRGSSGGVWSFLTGSVPLFTAFGIRVRAHASLLIIIACVILLDFSKGYPLKSRVTSMSVLAVIILLHEFGHCFAARWVGGEANDILMWPLGGLAFAMPPHRPLPVFLTAAAGPAVNVVICLVCGVAIWLMGGGVVSFNPFNYYLPSGFAHLHGAAFQIGYYLFWFYLVSYVLLLFNMLPIYPMDFGQILQAALWPKLGYRRSMQIACTVGTIGAVFLGVFGLMRLSFLLMGIAISCFLYCRGRLMMLREMSGDEFGMDHGGIDFSASLRPESRGKKRKRPSRWLVRRLRREAQREVAEQQLIDTILAKVSAHGMQSLTWSEKRALRRATERQRKQEVEMSRRN